MTGLADICLDLMREVDGALGAAVVDTTTGRLLAVQHNASYFTQSFLDAVAAAAVDMFRGRTVTSVERLLSLTRDRKIRHLVQEVQMTTPGTFHFMSVVPGKPRYLAVLITSREANLGKGWSALHTALRAIAPLCP